MTRDGALLAIRMGANTVNPGSVYFAAGSFEPVDFPNGVKPISEHNMAREVEGGDRALRFPGAADR